MTAYDRLRKVQDSQYGLAAAAPSDVAALLDEHEKLREELDALRKQEPVAWIYKTVAHTGFEELSFSPDQYRHVETIVKEPLYAAPVPAQPPIRRR